MLTRRQFSHWFTATSVLVATMRHASASPNDMADRFAAIERKCSGRLGVGIIDTQSARFTGYRADERFPMCSTHKALSAAAILARVDQGAEHLSRRVVFSADAVLPYSPVTKAHAGGDGMTMESICEAAVTLSDNTAANLLLDALGGPPGLTAYLRRVGDPVTRLDRTEPALNEAEPGDIRDTTTPRAMAANLNRLVLGNALQPTSRAQLTAWLVASKTGDARLRAGIPQGWRIGEKTGGGEHGTTNDVGVFWPKGREPIILAVFITGATASRDAQNGAIAEVARTVAAALTG